MQLFEMENILLEIHNITTLLLTLDYSKEDFPIEKTPSKITKRCPELELNYDIIDRFIMDKEQIRRKKNS